MSENAARAEAGAKPIHLAAASVGATDVFVFRRVSGDRYVHVGGLGRGEGWAGNIEISSDEREVHRAIEGRHVVRRESGDLTNVLGPYYARSAAFVPVSHDVAVLFGTGEGRLAGASEAELRAAAEAASEEMEFVSPAKRLADELEVLHAVDALTTTEARDVRGVMQHTVDCAAASLSCERAVLYLAEPELVAAGGPGSPLGLSEDEVIETMRGVFERKDRCPVCVQETSTDPLPEPFSPDTGVRSHYLLAIGNPPIGVLLLMHTDAQPRGFTTLCRELGLRLAERGEGMLRVALARELEERRMRAVAEANERLRELDRMKENFVSLMTHELRTPLTSIHGYVDLMLEEATGELTDDQRRSLCVVERNCGRLLRLVDDLLLLSRANAEGLQLELDEVDPATLAADAVEAVRPAADRKGIALGFAAEPVPTLRGDRTRLGQLLDNLLSNAVKFTADGGSVWVDVVRENGTVAVAVTDTGMGIPSQEQGRLFDRFFRSSTAAARGIPGTGLGLTLSKTIAEAHGGALSVASREGEGTTFRLVLPLEPPTGPSPNGDV